MPYRRAGPECVSQAELRRHVALSLQIARLQRQLDELDEGVYRKLKAGARVEPGTHAAEIVVQRRGGSITERVRVR